MTSETGRPSDLRSRARESIRVQVGEVAWNLFAKRGFDEVTASEVAQAAGISRATFFRYFSSKEEAVFAAQEVLGAEIATALGARPVGEDAWTALRHAFDAAIGTYAKNPQEARERFRLTRETPALRAHQLERQAQWQQMIGGALAARLGIDPLDLRVQALVGAALSALDAAATHWAESDCSGDLITSLDEAFAVIEGPHPSMGREGLEPSTDGL
jgi:AcrR family transcriptional regulator